MSMPRILTLCMGNPSMCVGFPSLRISNAKSWLLAIYRTSFHPFERYRIYVCRRPDGVVRKVVSHPHARHKDVMLKIWPLISERLKNFVCCWQCKVLERSPCLNSQKHHYRDAIMSAVVSQITSVSIVS